MVECSYTVVWYVHVTLTLFVFCNCLDVKKMPLGKISKGQIAKGFDALEEIEKVLNSKKNREITRTHLRLLHCYPSRFRSPTPSCYKQCRSVATEERYVNGNIHVKDSSPVSIHRL